MPFRRFAVWPLLAVILAAAAPCLAQAQQLVGRIVASVNDDAITDFDVDARVRLLAASSNLPLNQETGPKLARQALRELIDDRLKMQDAKRLEITASDQEIAAAVQTVERNNRMQPGGLFSELTNKGVPVETMIEQIKASLLWRKVLRRRVLPQVRVASEEVDDALARIRAAGGGSVVRAAEIFLPVNSADEAVEARALAAEIAAEATSDAQFAKLAAQHSRAPTAAVGGDLGEVQLSQLDPLLEAALAGLTPGQTSRPVETEGGVYVLRLIARRDVQKGAPKQAVVTLARAFLLIGPNATAQTRGAELSAELNGIDGCDAFERAAERLRPGQPPRVVDARIGDLPDEIRDTVDALKAGEQTGPIAIGDGVAVMMLCRRAEVGDGLPSAERVAEAIQNQRAQRRAERYLRDLRRLAFIDIRG